MVHEMGLSHLWPRAAKWQFCAGGLQGFVRGRWVTQPLRTPFTHRAAMVAVQQVMWQVGHATGLGMEMIDGVGV